VMDFSKAFEPYAQTMQQMLLMEAMDLWRHHLKAEKKKVKEELGEEGSKSREKTEGEEAKQAAADLASSLIKDPQTQKAWLSLTDEQRNLLLQAVGSLSLAYNLDARSALPFVLLNMANLAKSGGDFTAKDLVEATKSQIEILKTGAELSGKRSEGSTADLLKAVAEILKAQNGQQSQTSITEIHEKIVKPMMDKVDEVREEVQKERESRLQQEMESLRNSIRSPRDILKEFKETAETLGVQIGPGSGSSEEWRKDIEKMKLEQERWFKEQQLQLKRMELEHSWEKEKYDSIIEGIWEPLLDKAEPIFHEAGKALGDRWRGQHGGTDQQAKTLEDKVKSNCPHCGYEFWIPKDNPPKRIVCTKCNHVLELEEPEKAGEG